MNDPSPLAGADIVCIASIDWDFVWQGHQHVMAALARGGSRVLFIENTGVRSVGLRDLPRLRQRLANWRRGTAGFREELPNLFVYSPVLLPLPYSRAARWVNRTLLLRTLRRWMAVMGWGRPVVWTYLPTPLARDVIAGLDPVATVYYCIDDLASSSPAARPLAVSESALLREADLVFVTSEGLRQHVAKHRSQVDLQPSGVDFGKFERARLAGGPLPADVAALPRPIVGYVGGVHRWVDQELVGRVADAIPEGTVVLVGPLQCDVSTLLARPNVRCVGARPHDALPAYLRAFDVALVPYLICEYTAHVYPTKLNEYLAMGLPVVATPMSELKRFVADHGPVITLAEGAAFVDAVRAAPGTPGAEQRIETARRNDWALRLDTMASRVAAVREARLAKIEGWQGRLSRVYRRGRRRYALAGAALLLWLLLFQSPLVWWLAEPLRVSSPPVPADAIVVLAGGVGEGGRAGGGHQERVKHAVELHRRGLAPLLVFSSGYQGAFPEARVMRTLAHSLGVPESAIVLEEQARNTRDNVVNVRALLAARGARRVLLVSSPYHMRRASGVFARLAPELEVIASPVRRSEFYVHEGGPSLEQAKAIAQEYVAIVWYRLNGWL